MVKPPIKKKGVAPSQARGLKPAGGLVLTAGVDVAPSQARGLKPLQQYVDD